MGDLALPRLRLGRIWLDAYHVELKTKINKKLFIFSALGSSTKTCPVESFGEYRPQETKNAPAAQVRGGEVASYNP